MNINNIIINDILVCIISQTMSKFGEFEDEKVEKEPPNKKNDDNDIPLKDRLVSHLGSTNVVVKSQQKDEPDLTFDERKTILYKLLDKNPGQFLYR